MMYLLQASNLFVISFELFYVQKVSKTRGVYPAYKEASSHSNSKTRGLNYCKLLNKKFQLLVSILYCFLPIFQIWKENHSFTNQVFYMILDSCTCFLRFRESWVAKGINQFLWLVPQGFRVRASQGTFFSGRHAVSIWNEKVFIQP